MITERTLKQWRKDALTPPKFIYDLSKEEIYFQMLGTINILNVRILRMTQELLDQHLTKER